MICGCGDMDDGHEESCCFLVSDGDGFPTLEAGPEVFDEVSVPIGPFWASDRSFVVFWRDDRARAPVPQGLSKLL